MTGDAPTDAESNLAKFVRELSESTERVEEFSDDPEAAMSAAGLSEEEKEIIRRGDEEEILKAIGKDVLGIPAVIRIRNIRIFGV
jgi:hypothetical protein